MITRWGAAAVLLLSVLAGCGEESPSPEGADQTPTASPPDTAAEEPTHVATTPHPSETGLASTPEPTPASPPAADPGTRIVVAPSDFGPMLFDDTGQAIYLFDVETSSEPACYEACAKAWPPVLTEGAPVAGEGVRKPLLGTTERIDGSTQVTYDGHPLYFYAHEDKHEVKCHDVFLNGGNWYAVQPGGDAVPPLA
jgi:predicted lipoprotein with Yx(FWY)xxD motif